MNVYLGYVIAFAIEMKVGATSPKIESSPRYVVILRERRIQWTFLIDIRLFCDIYTLLHTVEAIPRE